MATIAESVQEELVWIGTAPTNSLRVAVRRRVDDPERYLCGAEKAAIACGYRLLVSWAATSQPEAHKARLVQAYEKQHKQRPGFKHPDTGEWTAGIRLLVRKMGMSDRDLTWSPWMPMDETFISTIPEEHGVYRVCAVPPQKRVPVVEMSDHSPRLVAPWARGTVPPSVPAEIRAGADSGGDRKGNKPAIGEILDKVLKRRQWERRPCKEIHDCGVSRLWYTAVEGGTRWPRRR